MTPSPKDISIAKHKLGPILIGTLLSYFWTGIAIVQLCTYLRKYKSDWIGLKLLVIVCAVLTFTTVILDSISVYHYAVLHFGDVPSLLSRTKSLGASFTILVIPSTLIQCFFGWRVMQLTGRVWVLVVVGIGAAAQLALRITIITVGGRLNNSQRPAVIKPYLLTWWCLATSVDVLISANLVTWFQTRRTGFQDTNDLLNRLTRLTIRTCGVVTVWTMATMISYIVVGDDTSVLLTMSLPFFYLITLISSLNSRYYSTHSGRLHWSDEHVGFSSSANPRVSRPVPAEIHVTRTTEADAFEIDGRSPTKSRMTKTHSTTRVIDIADAHSVQFSDSKADLEIGPDEHGHSIGAKLDYARKHNGEGQ